MDWKEDYKSRYWTTVDTWIHLFTNIRKANFTWIGKEDYKSRYWDNCRYLSIFLEISGKGEFHLFGRLQSSLLGQLDLEGEFHLD